jgi:hypothetical protein
MSRKTDVFTKAKRSEVMSRIRGKNMGLTCQQGYFGGLHRCEDQPFQNLNQPELEEVRRSHQRDPSWSPVVVAGSEVGRGSHGDTQTEGSGLGMSLRLQGAEL